MAGWAQFLTAIAAVIAAVGSVVNNRKISRAHHEATRAADAAIAVHDRIEQTLNGGNGDPAA